MRRGVRVACVARLGRRTSKSRLVHQSRSDMTAQATLQLELTLPMAVQDTRGNVEASRLQVSP